MSLLEILGNSGKSILGGALEMLLEYRTNLQQVKLRIYSNSRQFGTGKAVEL